MLSLRRNRESQNEALRVSKIVTVQRCAEKFPMKRRARLEVNQALKRGRLKRPETCFDCGQVPAKCSDGRSGLMADHYKGYNRENWLVIHWICRRCDGIRRRKY